MTAEKQSTVTTVGIWIQRGPVVYDEYENGERWINIPDPFQPGLAIKVKEISVTLNIEREELGEIDYSFCAGLPVTVFCQKKCLSRLWIIKRALTALEVKPKSVDYELWA